ncbi:Histone acetyltransferase of the MYST family 1 isoform 1 [Hibiscus syriacus]|uniref:Histone acetyltransferase of the MYST family 1 isoform 1 n=1 Tax=Hibiscus syriacus TaxID=106335 RepID=A0A6A2Y7S5_HIBSY|nr:Histone acetyltransferase of the MYST family 1 isoform 1 [Hibiscus syriacus]
MGSTCNRRQNLQFSHSSKGSIFLPMLCSKTSIHKDVVVRLPRWEHKSSDDPLSPKISCMGQVKRNNRIVGFPALDLATKTSSGNTNTSSNIKYLNLKKLFSGNNGRRKQNGGKENCGSSSISVENMDPPLPVVKRVPKRGDEGDGNTLWQRRSRGVSLESLQLQQIQVNRHQEPQQFEKTQTIKHCTSQELKDDMNEYSSKSKDSDINL